MNARDWALRQPPVTLTSEQVARIGALLSSSLAKGGDRA